MFNVILSCFCFFISLDPAEAVEPDTHRVKEVLTETCSVVSAAIDALPSLNFKQISFIFFMLFFILSPILFPVSEDSALSQHCIFGKLLHLVCIIITVILSGFLFYLVLNSREEYSVYKNVLQVIDIQLKRINRQKRVKENFHLE